MDDVPAAAAPATPAGAVPWFVWAALFAITFSVLGIQWDLAWHRSVGRDTFWSPPHVLIYLSAVLAGLSCAYLILSTSLGRSAAAATARAASVRVFGFYGPLGAFIIAWGGIAMLASAPFDDWWHNTYGLDTKILSPPHSVLALGMLAIQLGALFLVAGRMNRASGRERERLTLLFLYVGGFLLLGLMTLESEFTKRTLQHSGRFYRAVATVVPLLLLGVGRASGMRFGATVVAGIYTGILLLMLWLFPLYPAVPKLGPVYQQVTHLIPSGFPLLLVVPALGIDLAAPFLGHAVRSKGLQASLLGVLFVSSFLLVQWPMAEFLRSPAAHSRVFGSHYFSYGTPAHAPEVENRFVDRDGSSEAFLLQLGLAVAMAGLTARLGMGFGGILQKLRR